MEDLTIEFSEEEQLHGGYSVSRRLMKTSHNDHDIIVFETRIDKPNGDISLDLKPIVIPSVPKEQRTIFNREEKPSENKLSSIQIKPNTLLAALCIIMFITMMIGLFAAMLR